MADVNFTVAAEVANRFPEISIYAMRARGVAKALGSADTAQVVRKAAWAFAEIDGDVAQHPAIAAWRTAYARMGVKPSRYRSSIEALARRVAKGGDLRSQIPAVDLYNACSMQAWAPLGAYDVARLPTTDISLRRVRPDTDHFEPIGAEASAFPLMPGLVVYAAADLVLCWGFNSRDSRVAALTTSSDDVVFFSEAVAPDQKECSLEALDLLRTYLGIHGAACTATEEASPTVPSFALPSGSR